MKNVLSPASGWIVATFSLLALFLMGLSNPSAPIPGAMNEQNNAGVTFAADPLLGEITMFAGNFAPRGWAFCNGQLLPISENTALFSLLGTTYGGDGRTTFALPDMRGRVVIHPGTGPGLSEYRLGQKGGAEKVSFPKISSVNATRAVRDNISLGDGEASNIQPYVTVNYIIALQGVYPSRN